MPSFLRVVYRVTYDALYHFTEDDGWAMASHVALSTLLALFPFLPGFFYTYNWVMFVFYSWPKKYF